MKIILHIGIPKTGTSSLQKYLSKNKEFLLSQGFIYEPEVLSGGINYNRFMVNFVEDSDSAMKRLLNRLHFYEKHKKYKYYIISSEECGIRFKQSHIEKFYNYLKKYDIEIVMYIRRQDDLIESLYGEFLKCGEVINMQKFIELYNYDYKEMVTQWQRDERYNIHVIRYDAKKTIKNFCDIYNINVDENCDSERLNITPSANYMELITLILNNTDFKFSYCDIVSFIRGLQFPRSYRMLSLDERKAIMNSREASNMAISKQFFNGEPLFKQLPTTDTDYIGYPTITQNEIIKMLDKYLYYCMKSNNNINNLIKYISESGNFDENFYRDKYLCGRVERYKPIEHFVRFGMYNNLMPNKYFDVDKIYNLCPELKNTGIPPYILYVVLKIIEKNKVTLD